MLIIKQKPKYDPRPALLIPNSIDITHVFFPFHAPQVPETQEEPLEEDAVSQNDLEALMNGVKHNSGTSDAVQNVSEKTEVLGKWVCAQSSQTKSKNHNSHITDKLEQLAKVYTHTGDKWRALSYSKAVNALKSHHKPVSSYEVSDGTVFKHASDITN